MSIQREAIIWCPKCRENKGEVFRVPTGKPDVFEHSTNPDPMPKRCDCGAVLERRQ